MSNLILAHHGIKGQKWGDKNGPPYPLHDDDLSAAERKADTGKIDREPGNAGGTVLYGSPSDRYPWGSGVRVKTVSEMSNDELRKTVERMELENRYKRAQDAQRGKSFFEKAVDVTSTASSLLNNTNQIVQFFTGKQFGQLMLDRKKGKEQDAKDKKIEEITKKLEELKNKSAADLESLKSKSAASVESSKKEAARWKNDYESLKKSSDKYKSESDKWQNLSKTWEKTSNFWKSSSDTLKNDFLKSVDDADYWKSLASSLESENSDLRDINASLGRRIQNLNGKS